jgi:hypothetical protein
MAMLLSSVPPTEVLPAPTPENACIMVLKGKHHDLENVDDGGDDPLLTEAKPTFSVEADFLHTY